MGWQVFVGDGIVNRGVKAAAVKLGLDVKVLAAWPSPTEFVGMI